MKTENKILRIAFLFSLLLHLVIVLFFDKISRFDLEFLNFDQARANNPHELPLEFEIVNEPAPKIPKVFVETPTDAESERAPDQADFISDKNALARDTYQGQDKPTGDPYNPGETQYKVFSGTPQQYQPITENVSPTTPAKDNPVEKDVSQKQDFEPHSDDGYRRAERQTRTEKFDRSLLSQPPSQRSSTGGLFGSDDLNYQNLSTSVDAFGGISLNTYAWEWGPYLLYLKRLINQHIYPPPAFYRMGMISGETELKFKILRDGQVKDLAVLTYQGHESLMRTSLAAIKSSSPYKPLPDDFPEEYLELTVRFIYTNIR